MYTKNSIKAVTISMKYGGSFSSFLDTANLGDINLPIPVFILKVSIVIKERYHPLE